MLAQQTNSILASTYLWAENRMATLGGAYQVLTTRFFPTEDPTLPTGYQSYSAPLKGLIYDSGVNGAVIMNSVSGGGFSAPLTRGSGIHIDYLNARVVVPTSLGTNLVLTGTAAFKQINTYLANESEEFLLSAQKYFVNPQFLSPLTASGISPSVLATPAIFVNPISSSNEAFALGGSINSKDIVSLTCLVEDNFTLNALFSLFRDARYQYFPLLAITTDPLDQWGDFKGGTGYNYSTYVQTYGTPGNLVYIEHVTTSKVSDRARVSSQLFAGVIDLQLSYIRQPVGSNQFS